MNLLPYIIIVAFSFVVSFILKGLGDKYYDEELMVEEYDEKHKEEIESKTIDKKQYRKDINNLRSKFKPKFSLALSIFTAAGLSLIYHFLGFQAHFWVYSFLYLLLIICGYTDIKICIIPNEINFIGFITGIAYVVFNLIKDFNTGINLLLGGVVAALVFLAISGIGYLILRKPGMGGGDIKLMGVIGLYLGLWNFIQVFILSFLFSAIVSILLLITRIKKSNDYIPFGPFIVIATLITFVFPYSASTWLLYSWSMGI